MSFRTRDFRRRATQLRNLADEYRQAGMSTDEAVAWANRGFTPTEAQRWRSAGYGPRQAGFHADDFRSVEEALTVDPPKGAR
jgi:hypothetical protein